jgi:hypothetical protein
MLDEDQVPSTATGRDAEPVSRVRSAMQSIEGQFGQIGGVLQLVIEQADDIAELARSLSPAASPELDEAA